MPEIGRPTSLQEMQYRQVTMGPKSLSQSKTSDKIQEAIINKATGYRPKSDLFKEGPQNQMGKDEFLKLLTFQLQNQDPLNPMDQGKMTGELAQFSQLEQLTNLNKKFEDANKTKSIEDKFYAASFVGKKVVTNGSTINLKNAGDPGEILFNLTGDASKVLIRVLDEKNNIMGEIWRDGMTKGSHQVTWDGIALDGSPAVKGAYRTHVKAWDELGAEVLAKTEATGIVDSVSFGEDGPVLTVNGQKIYLHDVHSFHTAETQTHESKAPESKIPEAIKPNLMDQGLSQKSDMIKAPTLNIPPQQAVNAYTENTGVYD